MRGIWIGLALALASGSAWAQTPQQRDWCYSPTATDDQTVDGCTALIQSGRETTAGQAAAYDNRSTAYTNKGLYDQAIADETQALALNPNDPANANYNRGLAYEHKGLYDQAIADATRAIAFKPDYAAAYDARAYAYLNKGLYDQAIADETQSLASNPNSANAYQNRGIAYEKKGARDQAVADYRASLRLDPNRTLAREGLARLGATP